MTDRQPVGTLNKATLDKDGTDLAPADYEILPLNTLWPEIYSHCSDPEVQAQITTSARNWIKDHGWVHHKPEKDTWNTLKHDSKFVNLTSLISNDHPPQRNTGDNIQ